MPFHTQTLRRVGSVVLALGVLTAAACGGQSPARPTPVTPDPPHITCPAAPSTISLDGTPQQVSFPDPTVTAGAPPVSTKCDPGSGSTFGVGDTTVTCTVTDALQRTDRCTFTLTVAPPPPRLSVNRIVGFGDSITQGVLAGGGPTPNSYPAVLQSMLLDVYKAQPDIVVLNEGRGGEFTYQGIRRLPGVLAADVPQVLLLQEGVNDLQTHAANSTQNMVDTLRDMVKLGKAAGAHVFVATLLPPFPENCSNALPCKAGDPADITSANDRIRRMAPLEQVPVVDLYSGFAGQPNLVGGDGLHPTEEGYQRIAQMFFDAIRGSFEQPPPPIVPTSLTRARR